MKLQIIAERVSIAESIAAIVVPEGVAKEAATDAVAALAEVEAIGERVALEIRGMQLVIRTAGSQGYFDQKGPPPGVFVALARDQFGGAVLSEEDANAEILRKYRLSAGLTAYALARAIDRLRVAVDAVADPDEKGLTRALLVQLDAVARRVGVDDDQRLAPRLLGGIVPTLRIVDRDAFAVPVAKRTAEPPAPAAPAHADPGWQFDLGMVFDAGSDDATNNATEPAPEPSSDDEPNSEAEPSSDDEPSSEAGPSSDNETKRLNDERAHEGARAEEISP